MRKTLTAVTFLNLSALLVLGKGYRRWKDSQPITESRTRAVPSAVVSSPDPVKAAIRELRAKGDEPPAMGSTIPAIPPSSPPALGATATGRAGLRFGSAKAELFIWVDKQPWPAQVSLRQGDVSQWFVLTPVPDVSGTTSTSQSAASPSSAERGPARAGS